MKCANNSEVDLTVEETLHFNINSKQAKKHSHNVKRICTWECHSGQITNSSLNTHQISIVLKTKATKSNPVYTQ